MLANVDFPLFIFYSYVKLIGALSAGLNRLAVFTSLKYFIHNMKTSSSRRIPELGDFIISFKPKTVTFHKPTNATLKIYLEKSVQIIGVINENIPPLKSNLNYAFNEDIDAINFRILSQKYCCYQVSLYELKPNGSQQFIESSEFKLSKFINEYFEEFKKKDQFLFQQLKQKEETDMAELWRNLSSTFTRRTFNSAVKFQATDAIFQFICIPLHDYDELVRLDDIQQDKRRQKKQKRNERNEVMTTKPHTFSEVRNDNKINHKNHHQTESDITLANPIDFQSTNLDQQHRITKEDLQQFNIQIHQRIRQNFLSNIPQVEESNQSTIQIITGLQNKSKVAYDISTPKSPQILPENVTLPIPSQQKQMPLDSIHPLEQISPSKFYELRNEQGYMPVIHIQDYRELINTENHTYSKVVGNLSLQSVIDPIVCAKKEDSKIERAMMIAVLIVYAVIISFLMHPLSKTG